MLLLVIAIASYLQTLVGFSYGVIVVSAATLANIAPIQYSAAFVSLTSLFNIIIALKGNWENVDFRLGVLMAAGLIPGVLFGVVLLDYLSRHFVELLKLFLGLMVLVSAILSLIRFKPFKRKTALWMPITAGFLGGVGGGLFSSSSPPLVYYMYKLELPFQLVKNTLLFVFLVSTVSRIIFISVKGDLNSGLLVNVLFALPVIAVVTMLSKKIPTFLDHKRLKQLSFTVLVLMALALIFSSISILNLEIGHHF